MGLFGEFRDIRHYCNCLVNPGLALNEETMYVHYIYTGCPWFSLNLFHYLPFIRLTFLPINKQQFIFKIRSILSGIRLTIFIVNYIWNILHILFIWYILESDIFWYILNIKYTPYRAHRQNSQHFPKWESNSQPSRLQSIIVTIYRFL